MRLRGRIILASLFIAVAGLLSLHSANRVIAEARAPDGQAIIRVREFQFDPASLAGVFRLGEKFYRMEYYPYRGLPIFSCESYFSASFEVRKAEIRWIEHRNAIVSLDDHATFECIEGHWISRAK